MEEIDDVLKRTSSESPEGIKAIQLLKEKSSPKIYEKLTEIIRKSNDIKKINEAMNVLSSKKPTSFVIESIMEKLFSENKEIRKHAAKILVCFRETALEKIKELSEEKILTEQKSEIIWTLGQIGKKNEIKKLSRLKNHEFNTKEFLDSINKALNNLKKTNTNLWYEKKAQINTE